MWRRRSYRLLWLGLFTTACNNPPKPPPKSSSTEDADYAVKVPRTFDEAIRARTCDVLTAEMVEEVLGAHSGELTQEFENTGCEYKARKTAGYRAGFGVHAMVEDGDKAEILFYEMTTLGDGYEAVFGFGDEAALVLQDSDRLLVRYGNTIFWIQASRERLSRSPDPGENAIQWKSHHDRAIKARRDRLLQLATKIQEHLATELPAAD